MVVVESSSAPITLHPTLQKLGIHGQMGENIYSHTVKDKESTKTH